MKVKNEKVAQALMNALNALTDEGAAYLATDGGMLEFDLQTGLAEFWPGRKMEVHPHPKLILTGGKKNPVAKRLQLWVVPSLMSNEDMSNQHVHERLLEVLNDLVLDIQAKVRVLPKMMLCAQRPAGYTFLMPQAVYEEFLSLGGHPNMARPVAVARL